MCGFEAAWVREQVTQHAGLTMDLIVQPDAWSLVRWQQASLPVLRAGCVAICCLLGRSFAATLFRRCRRGN